MSNSDNFDNVRYFYPRSDAEQEGTIETDDIGQLVDICHILENKQNDTPSTPSATFSRISTPELGNNTSLTIEFTNSPQSIDLETVKDIKRLLARIGYIATEVLSFSDPDDFSEAKRIITTQLEAIEKGIHSIAERE
ncbi:hypothetical protein CR956_01155 [Candidatus Saccharibacteria bacterium]|nr:MAG: hypothetical protein CR956_01155 [Candidatus Saccharibacteria bacterium]